MDKANEILKQMPDIRVGLDSFYGQQTVLNGLNKALNTHNASGLFDAKLMNRIRASQTDAEARRLIMSAISK